MSFFSDNEGNQSSTRLIMVAWAGAILVVWIAACVYKQDMIDIPTGVGAILAYIVGGKAIQAFAEKPAAPKPVAKVATPK